VIGCGEWLLVTYLRDHVQPLILLVDVTLSAACLALLLCWALPSVFLGKDAQAVVDSLWAASGRGDRRARDADLATGCRGVAEAAALAAPSALAERTSDGRQGGRRPRVIGWRRRRRPPAPPVRPLSPVSLHKSGIMYCHQSNDTSGQPSTGSPISTSWSMPRRIATCSAFSPRPGSGVSWRRP
jgi:hypothetical protein